MRFNVQTAKQIKLKGGFHDVFQDGHGNMILLCISSHGSGKVAVNRRAYIRFMELGGETERLIICHSKKTGRTVKIAPSEMPKDWKEKNGSIFQLIDATLFRELGLVDFVDLCLAAKEK